MQNPLLKVLLSVNGDMSQVIQDHTTRKTFIKSALEILRQHNFDGLDIDWEFPDDAWKFMILLAEFRQAFGDRFLLTAAVGAPQFIADTSYKINVMSRYTKHASNNTTKMLSLWFYLLTSKWSPSFLDMWIG